MTPLEILKSSFTIHMRRLRQGSIIQVHLKEINKFIYLKFIDTRKILSKVSYPFQFRILNGFFDEPVDGDILELNFDDLLFSPLHLSGFLDLVETGEWIVLGNCELNAYDQTQHAYKMPWPPSLIATFEETRQWRVLRDINKVNLGEIVPLERCAHLEYAENLGASHLKLRVIIEYYKKENELQKLANLKGDRFEMVLISRYINMPIYSDLPKEIKGKVLDS